MEPGLDRLAGNQAFSTLVSKSSESPTPTPVLRDVDATTSLPHESQLRKEELARAIRKLDGQVAAAQDLSRGDLRSGWAHELGTLWDSLHAAEDDVAITVVEATLIQVEAMVDGENAAMADELRVRCFELMSELANAQLLNQSSAERTERLNEVGVFYGNIAMVGEGLTSPLADVARAEAEFTALEERLEADAREAADGLGVVLGDFEAEAARLSEGTSYAGLLAYQELTDTFARFDRRTAFGARALTKEDYLELADMLANDHHLWRGSLRAARRRIDQINQMLDVVAGIRARGEDDDAIVPGWYDRYLEERERLRSLVEQSPTPDLINHFTSLLESLETAHEKAWRAEPREQSIVEKGFSFVKGIVKAVVSPFIEAGHQLADLTKIAGHFATLGWYEPELTSGVAQAADQGQGTGDILKGMAIGIVETPKRWVEAAAAGDYEKLGEESANLFMLSKFGKGKGMKRVREVQAMSKARIIAEAGWKGGIDAQTAFRMRKLSMADGKVIEFRPVSKRVVELRKAGHKGKPVHLKMKTVKDIDVELGASASEVGMVGYFRPKMPSYLKDLPLEHQNRLRARYTKRLDEFDKMGKQVAELEANGAIQRVGNTIADDAGTPYTGDYDLFSITDADMKTGAGDYWKKMGDDVEHGPHLDWEVPGGSAEAFAELVMEYRPKMGAEKIIRFNPDGTVSYVTFND